MASSPLLTVRKLLLTIADIITISTTITHIDTNHIIIIVRSGKTKVTKKCSFCLLPNYVELLINRARCLCVSALIPYASRVINGR